MKKFFTLAAALMMLSASAETLDLYESTNWNTYVPLNGMWSDTPGNKTQVLYPAIDLYSMVGKKITSITFYTDDDGCSQNGGLMKISLGETEASVMTGYITEGMTQVGTFTFVKNESSAVEMTIEFDTPYEYNGGNLVFESLVDQPTSSFYNIYFVGENTGYDNCVVTATGGMQTKQFLPKTTFTYVDEVAPAVVRGDANGDGNVSISDISCIIDYLLSHETLHINLANADCNLEGGVTIGDVSALIDFLINHTW